MTHDRGKRRPRDQGDRPARGQSGPHANHRTRTGIGDYAFGVLSKRASGQKKAPGSQGDATRGRIRAPFLEAGWANERADR
jgi:hypothetical protein